MDRARHCLAALSHALHHYLLGFLLASYAVAALAPGFGLWLRDVSLGGHDPPEGTTITLPMLMLALLLVNAGLGVKPAQLRHLLRAPAALVLGLLANLTIPIAFILAVTLGMRFWHNGDEVQHILVGLALVASMPIAGSSTAWAQNSNGDLALSLGLVLFSTVLSPLTTPVCLHAAGLMAQGEYARELHALAGYGTGTFLVLCVVLPSLLGVALRWRLGEARTAAARPTLKLVNTLHLLLLSYSNAAVSLPRAVADPDWDFLGVTLAVVLGLCALAFASGWLIARLLRLDRGRQAALMFGLGMNNNGTGLVLASLALSAYPAVMLPVIFYNLVQHVIAGAVDLVLAHAPVPLAGAGEGAAG
jgi:BASS family bile acid:Na+ symporter